MFYCYACRMLLFRVHRTYPILKQSLPKHYSQAVSLSQNDYTESPEYPPILDMSLQGRKLRERLALHEKIRKISTVEEKQIALNMPRYYGWRCILLNEAKVPYNAMPLVKCYTRTHFIPMESLPEVYNKLSEAADVTVKEITPLIEEAIRMEYEGVGRIFNLASDKPEEPQKENAIAKCVATQINRIICNNLSDKAPHILSAQVDYSPRHEAFWFVGGVDVPLHVLKWRKKFSWFKDRLNENVDRPIQYIGNPLLSIRSHLPLPPILPYSEAENPEFKVPKFTHVPESVGYFTQLRHGTNIPGFWPGDYDEFGLLSIYGRGHILSRKEAFGSDDNIEALHCQAIKSSFGWLLAQANYQGFTTYNDLTYPLVTQACITNGQLWSFYSYQLNTIAMHNEHIDDNPKHNVCFGTEPLKLFDCIENGKVKGLNENVLKMLVQFYLNAPTKRDYNMKPYLGEDEQVVADIDDDNKRCWLEERYKHLVSNRPRHNLLPEIYLWEKIYKVQHNTRFFEAKRRPFELNKNAYERRLNEHLPPYIPKVLRPYPKSRKKFETTYYPDV